MTLGLSDESSDHRPTIALMGEFSAGKTTLINFLLGDDVLPTRVTATQLPPVWMSYGERAAYFVDDEGNETEIEIEDLATVGVEGVRYIRLFAETGILSELDLIDTPGISDPNIPLHFRSFVAETADALLWCTHATQAWRESERSALDSMPKELLKHSVLLATRSDKLGIPERRRVRDRLIRETDGRFANIIMFSAIEAIEACEMESEGELWSRSGGDELLKTLQHLSMAINDPDAPRMELGMFAPEEMTAPVATAAPMSTIQDVLSASSPQHPATSAAAAPKPAGSVLPRRVRRDETSRPLPKEDMVDPEVAKAALEPLTLGDPLKLSDPILPEEVPIDDAPATTEEIAAPEVDAVEAASEQDAPVDEVAAQEEGQDLSEEDTPEVAEAEEDAKAEDDALEEQAAADEMSEQVEPEEKVALTLVPSETEEEIEAKGQAIVDELAEVEAELAPTTEDSSEPEARDEVALEAIVEDAAEEEEQGVEISDSLIASIAERVGDAAQDADVLAEEAGDQTEAEPSSPAVAAWRAYREEHAPETMEELDALVASFLEAHSKASDDDQSDTADTGRAGWRLYV